MTEARLRELRWQVRWPWLTRAGFALVIGFVAGVLAAAVSGALGALLWLAGLAVAAGLATHGIVQAYREHPLHTAEYEEDVAAVRRQMNLADVPWPPPDPKQKRG